MSTDARSTNLGNVPDLLTALYAADVPADVGAAVDRRMESAISSAVMRRASRPARRPWHLLGRRRATALVMVAVLASLAATPAIRQVFDGWGQEFDRVFALSTPIGQSSTDDGYRVTLVRAYADPFSVRLAIVAEDLEDRGWAELVVGNPTITDEDGRAYAMARGRFSHHTPESSEGWLQFSVPSDATEPGVRHLTVSVDDLGVRPEPAPTLADGALDFDNIWTSVAGRWSFDFDLEFLHGLTVTPNVAATVGEVTVTVDELTVTAGASVGRLTFAGLPEVESGWDPVVRLEHDGKEIPLESNSSSNMRQFVFEAGPGSGDLSGIWTIAIDDFHRPLPDPDTGEVSRYETIDGPWVLTFEVPSDDAP